MKLKITSAIISSLAFAASASAASIILVDYDDGDPNNGIHDTAVLNGDFTLTDPSGLTGAQEKGTFVDWIGTGLARTDDNNQSGVGSDRNANTGSETGVHRTFNLNTGHTIASGDVFSGSFMWRSANNWIATDTLTLTLYYTDNNVWNGTELGSVIYDTGGYEFATTWETETFADFSFTDGEAVGKTLFIRFDPKFVTNPNAARYARFDNVYLTVVPEPSASFLGLAGMLVLLRRRRSA